VERDWFGFMCCYFAAFTFGATILWARDPHFAGFMAGMAATAGASALYAYCKLGVR
jgi:hypothetical protein